MQPVHQPVPGEDGEDVDAAPQNQARLVTAPRCCSCGRQQTEYTAYGLPCRTKREARSLSCAHRLLENQFDGRVAQPTAGGMPGSAPLLSAQIEALLRVGLFQSALRGAPPEAARLGMQQLLEWHRRGWLGAEALAEVALAYLAQHAPRAEPQQQQLEHAASLPAPATGPQQPAPQQQAPVSGLLGEVPGLAPGAPHPVGGEVSAPPAGPPCAALPEGQGGMGAQPLPNWAAQQAALDAVPAQLLRVVLEVAPARCRHRLFTLARRSPAVLGLLLSSADPGILLAEGHLAADDLLAALQPPPGQPPLPALAAVAAAAALLASAPPGPSPQLLHLVRLLAEGHRLMAIVEAGHLAPEELRAALAGAPPEAFTDIFKVSGWCGVEFPASAVVGVVVVGM